VLEEASLFHEQGFALSDHEFNETDLVDHQIDLESGSKPFCTSPWRLPYALRAEL